MIANRDNTIQLLNNYNIKEFSNIKFQELPFVKKINLRGNPENKNFMSFFSKILNAALPTDPNTYTSYGERKIIWLGPDEWLITDESENNNDLLKKLHNANGDQEYSTTDVSENRTIIRISGEKLFTLFSKFLVLDLENSFAKQSSVAQTLFIKVPILIVRIFKDYSNEPKFDIFVNRSHSNYIFNLLVDGTKNLDF